MHDVHQPYDLMFHNYMTNGEYPYEKKQWWPKCAEVAEEYDVWSIKEVDWLFNNTWSLVKPLVIVMVSLL